MRLYTVVAAQSEIPPLFGRDTERAFLATAREHYQSALDMAVEQLPEGVQSSCHLRSGDVVEVLADLERRFPGAALPEGLVGLLHRRTEGHPLFLVAVVESWISRGLAVEEKDGWTLDPDLDPLRAEIPETLRQMIERHLEELGFTTRGRYRSQKTPTGPVSETCTDCGR